MTIIDRWERRSVGISKFSELVSKNGRAVSTNTKLIEHFIARLCDSNSKISLEALKALEKTLPVLSG